MAGTMVPNPPRVTLGLDPRALHFRRPNLPTT